YTGVLEARNFLMIKEDLEAKGLGHLAHDYLMASGTLQTQLYKEEMEAALRTRDMAGVQLLGLQDFSGQGTALVGVVDAFWDEKPYVTPAEFREFCAPIVPLLRADGFVLTEGDRFSARAQLSQFAAQDIENAVLSWALLDPEGMALHSGTLSPGRLATGQLHDVGEISTDTAGLASPARFELVLSLDGTDYRNRWGLWVLPVASDTPALPIVTALDGSVLDRIAEGETLILSPPPETLKPNSILGHTAAFWNTLWTDGQAPHTLGLLIDEAHPLFARFPTASHTDWHWWELTHQRRALDVKGLQNKAIVRVVDDWNSNRDLVLCAEVRLGKGR